MCILHPSLAIKLQGGAPQLLSSSTRIKRPGSQDNGRNTLVSVQSCTGWETVPIAQGPSLWHLSEEENPVSPAPAPRSSNTTLSTMLMETNPILSTETRRPESAQPLSERVSLSQHPAIIGTSPTECSIIMNPTMAEDVQVLENYLTSKSLQTSSTSRPYTVVSRGADDPIVYITVPRRRQGLRTATDPGRAQREILEQILGPLKTEVIRLYFDHLHPCFPILDEAAFFDLWKRDPGRISSTLVCDIYCVALLFWNKSDVLANHHRPDLKFAWNQAVAALQDDFMAPTVSTIESALLDMNGRPVIQVTGNIVNAGRTVTLAHSLGLHRDPTAWKATTRERDLRIRLWWGVFVHDSWSSLAHGVPPSIQKRYNDVPVPTLESLLPVNVSAAQKDTIMTFLQLCLLTRTLGETLDLVYSLETRSDAFWRVLRRLECSLDDWEHDLPNHLRLSTSSAQSRINGSSNLWFCFLSLKLLLCRIAFRTAVTDAKGTGKEARSYRFAMLRDASRAVVEFICELQHPQLQEFWLSYTGHLLVSACTILLRCTVESVDAIVKTECTMMLAQLLDRLKYASTKCGWDLADFCIERCGDSISNIVCFESAHTKSMATNQPPTQPTEMDAIVGGHDMQDLLLPVDSLDFPWDNLWDTTEGLWSTYT
ncbi:hypothetical protein FKW77_005060 [Venturia effusa]|uniref:Xylanolytic transcriptional activator regulatory domain-containing protein n=1 Tax=Venturia effusa TaxID=50376 RepID=A0A517LDN9_9PEZI|nr:hypothetical protein FKW77_005060 [Venturia effusa]